MDTRKKLYPISTQVVTVMSEKELVEDPAGLFKVTYSIYNGDHFYYSTAACDYANYQPHVLAEGHYFREVGAETKVNFADEEQPASALCHMLSSSYAFLQEDLSPELSTITIKTAEDLQLACVSKNKKTIYVYNLKYQNVHKIAEKMAFNLREAHPGWHTKGLPIYSVQKNEKIIAITGFPNLLDHPIALALNTGEVKCIYYSEEKTQEKILVPAAEHRELKLFSTPQNLLIIHYPLSHQLKLWNLQNNSVKSYEVPALHKLKTSTDGKYFFGLEPQGAQLSTVAYVFQLNPFTMHKIPLPIPVYDFVIDANENVYLAKEKEVAYVTLSSLLKLNENKPATKKSFFSRAQSFKNEEEQLSGKIKKPFGK